MAESNEPVRAWSDGACSGNPGPGGFGAIMIVDGQETIFDGGDTLTTNNRMELFAALAVVRNAPKDRPLVITVDSKYVMDSASKWLEGWKARGWRGSSGKPVENVDIWKDMDFAIAQRGADPQIDWRWVKGHSGEPMNDRVDAIATAERDRFSQALHAGEKIGFDQAPIGPAPTTPPAEQTRAAAPRPSETNDIRTVTILFARPEQASTIRTPIFYVGSNPMVDAKYSALHALSISSEEEKLPAAHAVQAFTVRLQRQLIGRDLATLAALNAIAKAGLNSGTITLVGDRHPGPEQAHAVGKTVAEGLRRIGHAVRVPELERASKQKEQVEANNKFALGQ